jgi:peroxiredoxin
MSSILTLVSAALLTWAVEDQRSAPDFELPDQRNVPVRLADFADRQIVVVVFLGTECPLAKLYAPRLQELADAYEGRGVALVAINANAGDSAEVVARFAKNCGIGFPVLHDVDAKVADQFGATRQLEVFVLDRQRHIRYHGRVDDQFSPGVRRAAPTQAALQQAIEELLAGKPVTTPETHVAGCYIQRLPGGRGSSRAADAGEITYTRHIAPILKMHCVECHRPGQIGPFSLTTYDDVVAWSDTIRERIDDGSMPPWHADPRYGHFANDRHLTDQEKSLINKWLDTELPEGAARGVPAAARLSNEWNIGPPDKIVRMPEPVQIPATGVLENIAVELDPGFTQDTWIRGTEVRPGNRSVVHHCTVFMGPPGCKHLVDSAQPGLFYFSDFVPGLMPNLLPDGFARRLPAGWHIYFSLHYVPNGTATTDQTSMGLVLARRVRHEVLTQNLLNNEFRIEPYDANKEVEQSWVVPRDLLLLSLFPHTHLRGKSFRYEAIYPGGATETLLSVPRYDFMWQHRYVLAEPKLLPAGTTLRAVAHFDNSAANPANPDPSATVTYGKLTTDEMFHGYFDAAFLPPKGSAPGKWPSILALLAVVAAYAALRSGRLRK